MMPASATPPHHSSRLELCSRAHADRVALQLSETTAADVAVIKTGDALQPYRIVPADEAPAHLTQMEVRVS